MWRPLARAGRLVRVPNSRPTACRFSDDVRGGRGGRGGGQGEGGRFRQNPSGRGRGSDRRNNRNTNGGRGRGAMERFRQHQQNRNRDPPHGHRGGPKKENFAKTFLDPAFQGRLNRRHESGLPKLAHRKRKSSKLHGDFDEADPEEVFQDMSNPRRPMKGFRYRPSSLPTIVDTIIPEEDYDSEDEYDEFDPKLMLDPENHPNIYKDEEGFTVLEYDSDDDDETWENNKDASSEIMPPRPVTRSNNEQENQGSQTNPEQDFFYRDLFDFSEPEVEAPEAANKLMPLAAHGENLDDFLQVMLEHPTKYAEARRYNHHSESLREAKPDFPKNRAQPSEAFVTSHLRFIYVTGLPHHVDHGQAGDFENPIHRQEVAKTVSKIFGVRPEQVSPANMTSAFIGYKAKEDAKKVLKEGPKEKTISNPLTITTHVTGQDESSGFSPEDAVVKLSNVPCNWNAAFLARTLFAKGTELASIYGILSKDDIHKVSDTEAFVRLQSAEQAESAVESAMVKQRLEELGASRIRYFKAKRQLEFAGFTGPNKGQVAQRKGKRLVVSGDKPSGSFFRSHVAVVQLRRIDLSTTKKQISDCFQPFCQLKRDVMGSVEFVTCAEGDRTDKAYVGFDRPGELEAVVAASRGSIDLGNGSVATVKAMKEKWIPRADPREMRPERCEKELLDSLRNWEDYVDPEDVKELEDLGIPKEILSDAFQTMRYFNTTYGPMDWSMNREKLTPERPEPGQHMRETMKEYVETLKECAATPENPGPLYEAMFLPDEEVDLSVFEREKKRQAEIAKKRGLAGGS